MEKYYGYTIEELLDMSNEELIMIMAKRVIENQEVASQLPGGTNHLSTETPPYKYTYDYKANKIVVTTDEKVTGLVKDSIRRIIMNNEITWSGKCTQNFTFTTRMTKV